MKVKIKAGKVIPPPPPKRENKYVFELGERDAARLHDFVLRVSRNHVNELNELRDLGEIDVDVLSAFEDAGFFGNTDILPKGTVK